MAKDIYLILQGDFGEIAKKEQPAYIKSRFIGGMFAMSLIVVIFYKKNK
jgi:glycerol uptake facilitator-like aquaporin